MQSLNLSRVRLIEDARAAADTFGLRFLEAAFPSEVIADSPASLGGLCISLSERPGLYAGHD
jgi:hypothetical protein